MTELPPGTDTDALVASIMAAVRGFTGYRGIPHLAANRTEEQTRELLRQRAAKVAIRLAKVVSQTEEDEEGEENQPGGGQWGDGAV